VPSMIQSSCYNDPIIESMAITIWLN